MKNFALGFTLALLLVVTVAATVREDLYRKFGPMMIEAVVRVCQDEFNRNRTWHGQPQITDAQMVTALTNQLETIQPYTWMTNGLHP